MLSRFKNPNFYLILLMDLVLFILAHFGAYALRFEFHFAGEIGNFFAILPFLLVIKIVVFYGYGLYQGMWRYTGISDMWRLVQAVGISSMILVFLVLFVNRFNGFSRGVFILDGILTFMLVGGMRVGIRAMYQYRFDEMDEKGDRDPPNRKSGPQECACLWIDIARICCCPANSRSPSPQQPLATEPAFGSQDPAPAPDGEQPFQTERRQERSRTASSR